MGHVCPTARERELSKKKNRQSQNVVNNNFQEEYHTSPRESAVRGQYPVNPPRPTNMDELAVCADDQLYSMSQQFESERQKVLEARLDPYFWEVELAYLRRELGFRRQRREAHEAYVQKNAALFQEEEFFLPEYEDFNDGKRQAATN